MQDKGSEKSLPELLMIDDDESILEVLTDMLGEIFAITALSDPTKIAELSLQQKKFDAILTDINMPQMTIHEVIKQCNEFFPKTAIVLMSGQSLEEVEVQEALKAGAVAVLSKPFVDIEQVAVTIKSYILN
ncbi:MAG: response regulator [Oligoflexia bacterium]|nr:response regulator [Oligoflexia bacterium]MBF0367297.1 response regulator [Oligoflexia bacterium]